MRQEVTFAITILCYNETLPLLQNTIFYVLEDLQNNLGTTF